jgi:hypothetical protein
MMMIVVMNNEITLYGRLSINVFLFQFKSSLLNFIDQVVRNKKMRVYFSLHHEILTINGLQKGGIHMRQLYVCSFLSILLFTMIFPNDVLAQKPYAKWGEIAIKVTQIVYDDSEITEYQYNGRKEISPEKVEESFTFQVKENGKKDIIVRIVFNPKTEELQEIIFSKNTQ